MTILRQEGFRISKEAKSIAKRITERIPKDKLKYHEPVFPGGKPYLRFPLWHTLVFTTTAAEREVMRAEAEKYNKLHQEDPLIAHGIKYSGPSTLCQILLDGTLYHNTITECYGDLAARREESVAVGGYYDCGWGIFVAKRSYINNAPKRQYSQTFSQKVVPIDGLEGIVVPTQIAPLLREEFPRYSGKIYGYQGFAAKIRG